MSRDFTRTGEPRPRFLETMGERDDVDGAHRRRRLKLDVRRAVCRVGAGASDANTASDD